MTIKPIHTIIGQTARGDHYFPRQRITDEIWMKLAEGSNLLFVAPRRVGKSSVLFHLLDSPKDNFSIIYYISESVNNENEFYKKLFHHILEKMTKTKKYITLIKTAAKAVPHSIESIGPEGIKFRQESSINYYDELTGFIRALPPNDDKFIVLIDEFASTVENILLDEGDRAAQHFLQTKRSLRQIPETHKRLEFVYAGSIGLENIVGRLNSANLVNDLAPIQIPPLTKSESLALTEKILMGSSIALADDAFEHLLAVVEWWIPYYFQILLDESYKLLIGRDLSIITQEIINAAVNNALRSRSYFDPWFERLRKAYKGTEFSFVKELLNKCSDEKVLNSAYIYDCAVKYGLADSYNDLVKALKHDGYINNNDNPKIYRFNSSLLREWWHANIAN